jgi:hypothetical protein
MNTKKGIKAINLELKSNQNCPIYKGAEAAYHSGDYKHQGADVLSQNDPSSNQNDRSSKRQNLILCH